MSRLAMLECFDTQASAAPTKDVAFQSGYDEGFAAAQAAADDDLSRLNAETAQSISDLEYTFTEARAAFIQSLTPLMSELANTILPGIAYASLQAHIITVLTQAAEKHAVDTFTITVHPTQEAALRDALRQNASATLITSDPALPAFGAWVSHDAGSVHVDVSAMLDELQSILTATPDAAVSNGTS